MIDQSDTFKNAVTFFALACAFLLPATTQAQQSLSLSVTPPLFQMNINPSETFQSAIKIINNNPYPITVWAEAVEFTASGEDGHGRFVPVLEGELDESVMASWITIVEGPYNIGAEQSFNVPFTVRVPENAPPGGHSAAVLVGTRPPKGDGAAVVSTSQMVTSLFFARVSGDVVEKGDIREFSVSQLMRPTPEATFTLRFENEGNVHLKPTGNITVYNMWGKERGYIPVNQKTAYGNVLPESVRKYEFSWSGEQSLLDIGRYKAIATIGYGQSNTTYLDRTAYFWVVPVKATLITLLVVVGIATLVVWMIRHYIRRAMFMAGIDPDAKRKEKKRQSYITAPLKAGVIDLRARMSDDVAYSSKFVALVSFIKQYKIFALSIAALIGVVIAVAWYINDVRTEGRNYEVTLPLGNEEIQISSEEIIKERLEEGDDIESETETDDGATEQEGEDADEVATAPAQQAFIFEMINASGRPGTAAAVAIELEELGYRVDKIKNDNDREQNRSVIVYDEEIAESAVLLSNQLGNVPLSASVTDIASTSTESAEQTSDSPTLLLVVGTDLIREEN